MRMKLTYFIKWSSAGGASAVGSLLAILIVGAVTAVLGFAIQKSQMFFTGLSADASNTIWTLEIAFGASAVIFLIAVLLNHLINEKSDANQGV
jgi:hypothetical protein